MTETRLVAGTLDAEALMFVLSAAVLVVPIVMLLYFGLRAGYRLARWRRE